MKRLVVVSFLLFGFYHAALADHITGGEMFYTFLGKEGTDYQYRVVLKLFMRCNSGRRFNDPSTVVVFERGTNARLRDVPINLSRQENISLSNTNPCITNPPAVCYDVGYYEFVLSLPPNNNGYLLVSQVNFRIAGINNLTPNYAQIGATYTAEIPGTAESTPENHSAHFTGSDLVVVCANNSFSYSFAAEDGDGDQLRYSFCNAYVSGTSGVNAPPPQPPYASVPYRGGFSGQRPLGPNVQLNPSTGLITGVAPAAGVYVVTVCVEEVRNGTIIAVQRKDLQINITECTIAAASLLPEYLLCKDTKKLTLTNFSNSPLISTYLWQIQDQNGAELYSSDAPTVSYEFADTGMYKVDLYINKGQQCSDSVSTLVRVYPGLSAGFRYTGICVNKPTSFFDTSSLVYGSINSWYWDFEDPLSSGDTSDVKNPVYTYSQTGSRNVSFTVSTTKGCSETIVQPVNILDKPPLNFTFRDTLICKGDTLQLGSLSSGSFSWSPSAGIINANSPSPRVYPAATTTYMASLNDNGCINTDSVRVRVVDFVSLQAFNDTVICEKDAAFLSASTDGLQFAWTPALSVSAPGELHTSAFPGVSTTYQLTATIGHCTAKDEMTVRVVPYPEVNAGMDTVICFHSTCQLVATTNGSSFAWSPSNSLINPRSLTTMARPAGSTAYVLTAYDTRGCPKPARDTVLVTVLPKIIAHAGNDTAVVIGEPLQLHASGGVNYVWSPGQNLSSVTEPDPVAVFFEAAESMHYAVLVYNEAGCVDTASVRIKIYQSDPVVFVPTAFTPNGDGRNDILRPLAAGITTIEYFRIYNRWGQMVFSTTTNGKGWDGRIQGRDQSTASFVWEVKATDYKGQPFVKKGTVTLIR
jgi:gliding motility-associated-like protein